MAKEFKFTSAADGLEISCLMVLSEREPKGIFQILHGMAEHKERYIPMMEYLASQGFICVVNDHRGHGGSLKSSEDRGYMYKGGWLAMVNDAHQLSLLLKEQYPGLKLILYGHSMGSLVARSYTKRYPQEIAGLIVSGSPSANPAAGAGLLIARAQRALLGEHHRSRLLHSMSFGAYNNAIKKASSGSGQPLSPNAWLSHDQAIVDAYDASDDCGYVFTTNGFINLLQLMQDCYSLKGWKMTNPKMPILFVSGAEDPCRTNDKAFYHAVECMQRVGYENVTAKLYSKMRHEVHNEIGREEVWKDLGATAMSWLG